MNWPNLSAAKSTLPGLKTAACLSVFLLVSSLPATVKAEPTTFLIDDEHFSMAFEIMHIGYAPVIGMFREVEGEFVYDESTQEISSGELIFRSDSVFTNHKKRDQHLRADDFLDSKEHPEITFTLTGFEKSGDNSGKITGDLTLLGRTKPVVVDVTLNKKADYPIGHEDYTLGITATATLKRSDWGMTYGLDPALVGDEVSLRFGFEANKESGFF